MSSERIVVPGAKMDGNKKPPLRRVSQGRVRSVRSGSEGHIALSDQAKSSVRSPSPASVGLPGCGLLRKSASSVALSGALEDEFSPGRQTTVSTITLSAASTEANSLACTPYLDVTQSQSHADRGTEVTVDNAQGIWPAEAVVFVANLSTRRSLEQHQQACHDLFDPFGRNVIKIKLDRNKHPFALVQFEKIEAANAALASIQGVFVDGRPIRLEHGRAERAVIICRKDGAAMTERDARAALEPFGALAVLCKGDSDALRALSGSGGEPSVYRLQLATSSGRREQGSRPRGLGRRVGGATRADEDEEDQGDRADTTDKTIFVGNLPPYTTSDMLAWVFSGTGTVVDARVISKQYRYGCEARTFGFVEFATCAEAEAAMYAPADKYLDGRRLRVEGRGSKESRVAGLGPITPINET
ncbi:hypothetical protein DV738_g278, partial [Chaetothyriales sp. CBS 135597]